MHLILFKSEADGLNVFPKPDPPLAFPIPGILYSQTVLEHRCANLKARKFQKNIYFCFTDYAKAFDCMNTTNCGKFFKRWEYQTTLPAS